MPLGATVKLVTPGQNQKPYLAGALELKTGRVVPCRSIRKTTVVFRALLDQLEWRDPKAKCARLYVVGDNYGIHNAKAVERGLVAPPRFAMLSLPTYCPQANPIERAFGDVHAKCTRTHQRKRLEDLIWDVEQQLSPTGPWHYHLSPLSDTPAVTAAVERLTPKQQLQRMA